MSEYLHERQERVRVGRPLCAELPPRDSAAAAAALLQEYLTARGLSGDIALHNGWYVTWWTAPDGQSVPRIVIPCTSLQEGNRFWQARAVTDDVLPRYDSPHNARGDALVVVNPSWPQTTGVAVVEGPMDALAAAGAGYTGIALMGVTPSMEAKEHLRVRLHGRSAVFVADSDAVHAMLNLMAYVIQAEEHQTTGGCPRKLVMVYPYKDLAEIPPGNREEFLSCDRNTRAHETNVVRLRHAGAGAARDGGT